MSVFEVQNINKNDEITQYQVDISAATKLFGTFFVFPYTKETLLSSTLQYIAKTANEYILPKKIFSKEHTN